MPRNADDEMLEILLSALTSVMNGTGAICSVNRELQWQDRRSNFIGDRSPRYELPRDTVIDAKIAVSKFHNVDTEAIKSALGRHGSDQAEILRLTKANEELLKDPKRAEMAKLRKEIDARTHALERLSSQSSAQMVELAELRPLRSQQSNSRVSTLERQVTQLQGRVAQLQNELISARAQRPPDPPPPALQPSPPATDDTSTRFSMLELD